MLSNSNKGKLEKKGIILFCGDNYCHILKKKGINGNSLPNYTSIPIVILNKKLETESETISDCPTMMLSLETDEYRLICWDWVPGPGPGDFELYFKDENSVVDFIESYYFGDNEYFKKRLEYERNKNCS